MDADTEDNSTTDPEDEIPGILDKTLIQLFENISRARGNNITVFLDCASHIFTWEHPSSFVVVAPKRATETKGGGTFTKSLINVLRSEKLRIRSLTVQSFADKIQADMGGDVHCYGQNVGHLLFNPAEGQAYHTFISGKTTKSGGIMVAAGFAHGVQGGTMYGIYENNVRAKKSKVLGHLVVSSVDNATSSTLHFPRGKPSFTLPTVFYAVEIRYPDEKVMIFFCDASVATIKPLIKPSQSWKQVGKAEDANMTLKFTEGTVWFSWNGVVNDPKGIRDANPCGLSIPVNDENRILRMVRNAARFTYHLTRSASDDSSLSVGMQLQKVDDDGLADGVDILCGGFTKVNAPEGEKRSTYCLILRNNSKVAVWPFVFQTIAPWYMPHPATMEAPLEPGGVLTIGCENEQGLQFHRRYDETFYIKVFVTTERTSFSSLIQYFKSPREDILREADDPRLEPSTEPSDDDISGDVQQPSEVGVKWITMRMTITKRFIKRVEDERVF